MTYYNPWIQNIFQNTAVCRLMADGNRWLGSPLVFVFFPAPLQRQNPFCPLQKGSQVLVLRVYLQSEIQFLPEFSLTPIQPWFHPVTSPQYLHNQTWKMALLQLLGCQQSKLCCFSQKHSQKEGTIKWWILRCVCIALDTSSLKTPTALT